MNNINANIIVKVEPCLVKKSLTILIYGLQQIYKLHPRLNEEDMPRI